MTISKVENVKWSEVVASISRIGSKCYTNFPLFVLWFLSLEFRGLPVPCRQLLFIDTNVNYVLAVDHFS